MAGRTIAWCSRRLGRGAGAIIGGRVTAALAPDALAELARQRQVVLVTGTNGKTTTSHLLAAALRTAGAVAHNHTGANMPDGVLAALCAAPGAPYAVLEVDELHLARVAGQVRPRVIVLLNLSRDQLDRGGEVRAVSSALAAAVAAHPEAIVVANADDPLLSVAASRAARVVWVAAGTNWLDDSASCPSCGRAAGGNGPDSPRPCPCGPARPVPDWTLAGRVLWADGQLVELRTRLPGEFNVANAAMAVVAAAQLGVTPVRAVEAIDQVDSVAGRYSRTAHGEHRVRLVLAKNPAGWAEALGLLVPDRPVLFAVNAREADGRDTSWLWDVDFAGLAGRDVVVSGERGDDLALRLGYAEVGHRVALDPLAGLRLLPPGPVDVVANYTAFRQLHRRLARAGRRSAR